jgi:hypothetical protein
MFRDSNKLHGNICPQTIGNKNGIGYLLDSNSKPFNPAFQSMLRLNKINLGNDFDNNLAQKLKKMKTSYVDELESFFYVIAYMCMRYSRRVMTNAEGPPNPIWISDPLSYNAVIAKERISDFNFHGALPWPHSTGEAVLFSGLFKALVTSLIKAREADSHFQLQGGALTPGNLPSQTCYLEDHRFSSRSLGEQRVYDVVGAYSAFVVGIDEVLSRVTQL